MFIGNGDDFRLEDAFGKYYTLTIIFLGGGEGRKIVAVPLMVSEYHRMTEHDSVPTYSLFKPQ